MSDHREIAAAQSAPSIRTLAQPSPNKIPQVIDWFAESERLRADREKRKPQAPTTERTFEPLNPSEAAMTFIEIAEHLGTTPQYAQYIFNRAMKKLARARDGKPLQDLRGLMQLRQELVCRHEVVEL